MIVSTDDGVEYSCALRSGELTGHGLTDCYTPPILTEDLDAGFQREMHFIAKMGDWIPSSAKESCGRSNIRKFGRIDRVRLMNCGVG